MTEMSPTRGSNFGSCPGDVWTPGLWELPGAGMTRPQKQAARGGVLLLILMASGKFLNLSGFQSPPP